MSGGDPAEQEAAEHFGEEEGEGRHQFLHLGHTPPSSSSRLLPAAYCLLPAACRPRPLPLPLPAPLPPPRRLSPAAAGRPQVKLTYMDEDAVRAILAEYRINSADVRINCDATPDELIDVIEGNRVYMPCVYALNKIDAITMEVWLGPLYSPCDVTASAYDVTLFEAR